MSRILLVTVGTSILESATWEPRGPLEEVPGYRTWTRRESLRTSPKARSRDALVAGSLREALLSAEPAAWAEALPEGLAHSSSAEPMRFSAEVATVLKLAEAEAQSPAELLAGYDRILLPADPDPLSRERPNPSLVAAVHLKATLDHLAGRDVTEVVRLAGLGSSRTGLLTEGLRRLGAETRHLLDGGAAVDVVASGGFKIYGYLLTPFLLSAPDRFCLLYIHEEGDALVKLTRDRLVLQAPDQPEEFLDFAGGWDGVQP